MTLQEPPRKSHAGLIIGIALIALMGLCCLGSVAALAVPSFASFGSRSKQSEAKFNLKSAYSAERAYFAEFDTYEPSIDKVGFLPERGNRYRYVLSNSGDALVPGSPDGGSHTGVLADTSRSSPLPDNASLLAGIPPALLGATGLKGTCPEACDFTIVAAGNIDGDATVDVWSISTQDRTFGSERVPAGAPFNHVDDNVR